MFSRKTVSMSVCMGTVAVLIMSACSAPAPDIESEVAAETPEQAKLMTWGDLTSRRLPKPTIGTEFGIGETDLMDLWIPDGEGPFPVVLMIHGGCWQKSIADRSLMNYAAESLRRDGMAVVNIEYRGVDEAGGGYPGTFTDVARAAAFMPRFADEMDLDMTRVAGFGHSAGGHLVTWLAGIHNLPEDSEIARALADIEPLKMVGVINSGGLADLDMSEPVTLSSCLSDIKDKLTGPVTAARPDPLADTSSDRLLPSGTTIYSVNGARDRIAPASLGEAFTQKAKSAGDSAQSFTIADEGHVELIAPGSAAFDKQTELLKAMLGLAD